jgi:hypothetical protein
MMFCHYKYQKDYHTVAHSPLKRARPRGPILLRTSIENLGALVVGSTAPSDEPLTAGRRAEMIWNFVIDVLRGGFLTFII